MSDTPRVGFALQPDEAFLSACAPLLLEDVDYYEVTPETMWRPTPGGELVPNGFHRLFSELGAAAGKPFVAHGVGFSMGSTGAAERRRRRHWLTRIRRDHEVFRFEWYTDHLGATVLDGCALQLPIALPMTATAARVVRLRLDELRSVVPDVGVENTAAYFLLGDPLDEPSFLAQVLRSPRTHLLLDLHNVFVMAENMGFEPEAYLERLDLDRVIEIHVSGGVDSSPAWLASGATLRLDSHDASVPEAVWALLERYAGRCRNLRGVTLERMEGTVADADVPELREEIRRIRAALRMTSGVAA